MSRWVAYEIGNHDRESMPSATLPAITTPTLSVSFSPLFSRPPTWQCWKIQRSEQRCSYARDGSVSLVRGVAGYEEKKKSAEEEGIAGNPAE